MRSEGPRVPARIRGRQHLRDEPVHAQQKHGRCSAGSGPRRRRPTETPEEDTRSRSGSTSSMSSRSPVTAIPVNPTDAIATVNGEVITRQQLADECVARKGEEILETLIARTLIEQALQGAEAGSHGRRDRPGDRQRRACGSGIGREAWLRTLDKERGISPRPVRPRHHLPGPGPAQARAPGRSRSPPKDMKDSFEAQYGDKLRVPDHHGRQAPQRPGDLGGAAEEPRRLREARPGAVDGHRAAGRWAACSPSRSPATPIPRTSPTPPSPARRRRPERQGPQPQAQGRRLHRARSRWPRRPGSSSAARGSSRPRGRRRSKNERIKKQTYEMIYEVKLKEAMGVVFAELMKAAAIDNKLTGSVKLANEEQDPDQRRRRASS